MLLELLFNVLLNKVTLGWTHDILTPWAPGGAKKDFKHNFKKDDILKIFDPPPSPKMTNVIFFYIFLMRASLMYPITADVPTNC